MKEEDVKKLATLCRIDLTGEEAEKLRGDMESILKYVSEIKQVVAEREMSVASPHRNIMRDDGEPHESGIYTADLISATPEREGEYVKVKAIL